MLVDLKIVEGKIEVEKVVFFLDVVGEEICY